MTPALHCLLPGGDPPPQTGADLRAPGAFELFLTDFKSSPEEALAHAIGDVTIAEDDISDDDLMDDDETAQAIRDRQRAAKRGPQPKYKNMMQDLADRKIEEVIIDLDDLADVSLESLLWGCAQSIR